MLDDLKMIHTRDASDALGIAEKQSQELGHEFDITPAIQIDHVYNIVYAGMGGSALAAEMLRSWPALPEPFQIVKGYDLPDYVDADTLVIVASYSGNTEEALSALDQAIKKSAQVVVITDGGELATEAKAKNLPLALIPPASQPRYAVFYMFKALLSVLGQAGVIKLTDVEPQLRAAQKLLEQSVADWLPTVPTSRNPAKKLALELMGKSIVVYAGPLMFPAAYKWKISFNENAKNVAWCNQLSEFDHNEIMGWTSHPVDKPYSVIELRSELEHPRIQKRFQVGERLLSGLRPAPEVVQLQGKTVVEQLLWAINFGDFVSVYLALLNGLDPSPVDFIEKFKKELG